MKGQGYDPHVLKAQYLENSLRCCLATIAKESWDGSRFGWRLDGIFSTVTVYRIYLRISRPLKIESVCCPKSLTRV